MHKIKPENIEFADLLKCENDTVTIVHVKDGFDGEMRILDRQVELSISKIIDLKHRNNDTYIRKLYKNASKSDTGLNITSVFPTVDKFIECLKESKIIYLVVIRPKNKELLKNTSNIAKHCLNSMIVRCFNSNINLKIQIL